MSYAPLPVPSHPAYPAEHHGTDLSVPPASWGPPPAPPIEARTPWHRYLAALKRFKWLIAGCTVLGAAGGYAATRFVAPEFEARATMSIALGGGGRSQTGPIQAEELLGPASWEQLFRSLRVTDSVVVNRRLYLHFQPTDSDAFVGFNVVQGFQTGAYDLAISPAGDAYTLSSGPTAVVERGAVGDSIGRKLGFRWQPSATVLRGSGRGHIRFSLQAPSDASQGLTDNVTVSLPDNSQIMGLTLDGPSSTEVAGTLNEWLTQFVAVAADLKRRKVTELTSILGTQLQIADLRLKEAERGLEGYETSNIARGAAAEGAAADPGAEQVKTYYDMKVQHDNLQQDLTRVRQVLGSAAQGQLNPEDLTSIPSLMIGSDNLRAAIQSYSTKQNELRDLKLKYTDDYKPVRDLQAAITALQTQTIPQLAAQSLSRLTTQDQVLTARIGAASGNIVQMPSTQIEITRRKREVDQAAQLYNSLQSRYEEARLAQESAIPDVQILDRAAVPLYPTRNTKPRVFFMAVFAGLGAGLALALLLERLDRRVRYPEQATDELGLPIIGTVPTVRPRSGKADDEAEAAQVVEAFRTLRLNLMHLFDPMAPMLFTITSPGSGEGKSLISSNLAMSFAESGRRTLLVDGDIRRGQLHSTFRLHKAPGLLDYLARTSTLEEVLQPTDYENLSVISCGGRQHRGPELLASDRMLEFLTTLRPHFDTIVVDSPPLGAGIDPFALGAATGHMLVVLRVGRSDRQMAQAKLGVLDRYPVRLLGAVLNDVRTAGVYRYYSYLYGYQLEEAEMHTQLPSRVGEVGGATSVSE